MNKVILSIPIDMVHQEIFTQLRPLSRDVFDGEIESELERITGLLSKEVGYGEDILIEFDTKDGILSLAKKDRPSVE